MTDERFSHAIRAYEAGRYKEAELLSSEILRDEPDNFRALNMLGMCLHERGESDEGAAYVMKALARNSQYLAAYNNLAAIYKETKQFERALAMLSTAIDIFPDSAQLFLLKATILLELDRSADAIESLNISLQLEPGSPEALTKMGAALSKLGRYPDALIFHKKALGLRPDYALAWLNIGQALNLMKRYSEALAACDKAIALDPNFAEAHVGRGHLLHSLGRYDEALAAYQTALKRESNLAEAWAGLGLTLCRLGRRKDAFDALQRAETLNPGLKFLPGDVLHAKMQICDWRDFENESSSLIARVENSQPVADPFMFLSLPSTAAQRLRCAKIYAETVVHAIDRHKPVACSSHSRIRLGYISADFREHAVAHLISGVLERHDKSRFEIFAISLGRNDNSSMRTRIERAVEHFIDVHSKSDQEVVNIMRDLEIDIAIDLTGYTQDARTNVLATRPAPLQINFLGYAGTMGADFIDYIVADETVIPIADQPHYKEKIVYLPDTYFSGGGAMAFPGDCLSRSNVGLPEKSFVFCSFVNSYKITPDIFSIWMRLLAKIEGSVLWLQAGDAAENLRREARARGILPERLVFAARKNFEDYLAQHRLADLFLDTLYFNAHTTASHALWMGLPVLTCLGSTMAGRGGASILGAIGLPELVAKTAEEYEALAIRFAADPVWRESIRAKLAGNRKTHPLFDTARYTRHLEAAYDIMWRRYNAGERPECFRVRELKQTEFGTN
jgi:protein O-GlcNAc transferase